MKTPIVEDRRKGKANVTIVVRGSSSGICIKKLFSGSEPVIEGMPFQHV